MCMVFWSGGARCALCLSVSALNKQNGHEKVVLGMRMSVSGALVSQQAKMVYSSCSAEMQIKV